MTEVKDYDSYRIGKAKEDIQVGDGPQGDISAYVKRPLYYRFLKRFFDIVASSLALLILSPLMIVVAFLIWIEDFHSPFFKQERIGLNGKHYWMYKFRSMKINAEEEEEKLREQYSEGTPEFKLKRDPRVTKIGRIIRKTSIDEIPQFVNCIIGNMTIVGPRPMPLLEYSVCDNYQKQSTLVKPGITCIWQCSGRSKLSFDERIDMDLTYIKTRSVLTDLIILLKTVKAVLLQDGAY